MLLRPAFFIAALALVSAAAPGRAQELVPAPGPAPAAQEEWPPAVGLNVIRSPDWTSYAVYPSGALTRGQQGSVAVEALVGRDGIPRRCRVVRATGQRELDEGTCEAVLRMRFAPPVGPGGESIEATHAQTITWVIAATRFYWFGPSRMTASLTVEGGVVMSCTHLGSGSLFADWSRFACRAFTSNPAYFLAAVGAGTRHVTIDIDMTPAEATFPVYGRRGRLIASRRIEFRLNRRREAGDCRTTVSQGLGVPVNEHLASCTLFLPRAVQFRKPPRRMAITGVLRIMVYED